MTARTRPGDVSHDVPDGGQDDLPHTTARRNRRNRRNRRKVSDG
ncbi:hypothetical protein SSCG_00609 [Streptomyces clavuligerus]|nr:hypothetical protein SSCG_00609 [Streptomyces clavuligerus]